MTNWITMTIDSTNFEQQLNNLFHLPNNSQLNNYQLNSYQPSISDTFKQLHYSKMTVIIALLVIIIFSNRNIFLELLQKGFFISCIEYNIMPAIYMLTYICIFTYNLHKETLKSLPSISSKKSDKSDKSDKNTYYKTPWGDIADICNTNLDTIFTTIINDFQNNDINTYFGSPLSKYVTINKDDLEDILIQFTTKNGVDINNWKNKVTNLKNNFSVKYKEYKIIEGKLIKIKSLINELNEWAKKTEQLLKQFNDKQNIKLIIKKYITEKINNYNYPNLIKQYQQLYLELKVYIKFLSSNLEIETLSKCPICLTHLKDSVLIPCGHCACKSCFEEQEKIHKKIICPMCRTTGTKIGKLFM